MEKLSQCQFKQKQQINLIKLISKYKCKYKTLNKKEKKRKIEKENYLANLYLLSILPLAIYTSNTILQ